MPSLNLCPSVRSLVRPFTHICLSVHPRVCPSISVHPSLSSSPRVFGNWTQGRGLDQMGRRWGSVYMGLAQPQRRVSSSVLTPSPWAISTAGCPPGVFAEPRPTTEPWGPSQTRPHRTQTVVLETLGCKSGCGLGNIHFLLCLLTRFCFEGFISLSCRPFLGLFRFRAI